MTEKDIIDAYGDAWEKLDKGSRACALRNNGYVYFTRYEESPTPSFLLGEDNIENTFDYSSELAGERPKSLSLLDDDKIVQSTDDEMITLKKVWFERKTHTETVKLVDGLAVEYYLSFSSDSSPYYGTVRLKNSKFYIVWEDGEEDTLISNDSETFNKIKNHLGYQ